MRGLYSLKAVEQAVNELEKAGYEIIVIDGCLIDSYVCIAPDENHWNYIFYEHYLNEWSSAYKVRRCSKISKRVERWMEQNGCDAKNYWGLS